MPQVPDADLGFFSVAEPAPEPVTKTASVQESAKQDAMDVDETQAPPPPPPPSGPPLASLPFQDQYAPTLEEIETDVMTELARKHWNKIVKPVSPPVDSLEPPPTPNKKKTKGKGKAKKAAVVEEPEEEVPATVEPMDVDNSEVTFDPDVVETIWQEHLQGSEFSLRKIMLLEFNLYLEKYLWPFYVAKSGKESKRSSLAHLLSIIIMINEKFRENGQGVWDILTEDPTKFSAFVARALKLLVEADGIDFQIRRFILIFAKHLFQSLENTHVRAECLRLASISCWSCLVDTQRERALSMYDERRAAWDRFEAKLESTTKPVAKEKMEFDRMLLSRMIKNFFTVLHSIPESGPPPLHAVAYCERFLEFLICLLGQLPTRRYVNLLVKDHLVIPICESSKLATRGRNFQSRNKNISLVLPTDWSSRGSESGALFVQLLENLSFYARFEIDDYTGAAIGSAEKTHRFYESMRTVQKLAFVNFRETMEEFALANVGSVERPEDLRSHLTRLDAKTMKSFCALLGYRTSRIDASDDREEYSPEFLVDVLVHNLAKFPSQIQAINALPLYPDENSLFDETMVPSANRFSNTHCLAIPQLSLQFLTVHDYLWRNFHLFRLETTYEIRQDIEDVVQRLAPKLTVDRRSGEDQTVFTGWSRMGAPIDMFQIVDVAPPKLGESKPATVKADLTININRYTEPIQKQWEELRPHDVLFLLTIQMDNPGWVEVERARTGGAESVGAAFRRKYGLKFVRGCEILHLLDDNGKPIEDWESAKQEDPHTQELPRVEGSKRSFRVLLDTNQYQDDFDAMQRQERDDVYTSFNVLVRRRPQENNFKAVLETIRDLMQDDTVIPDWLQNIFLGYGDRGSAHFTKMAKPVRTIDFRDTFLDWDHLTASFPDRKIVPQDPDSDGKLEPPYVVTFPKSMFSALADDDAATAVKAPSNGKGKRKLVDEGDSDALLVRSYTSLYPGPYSDTNQKTNKVRFTPAQIEAIHAGTSPGLSMIVGPPGTGKTDIAVQIIATLYHNFPQQHTLIITHSNTALNQIFEKIAALDIDPRHLLRLGHGQDDLALRGTGSWGKYGRVAAFLEKRVILLAEVDRLAASLEIPGAHGYTCETAGYFYMYHILSLWQPYALRVASAIKHESATRETVVDAFPFSVYFSNTAESLFPEDISFDQAWEIAEGCWRHICGVFDELNEMRAFELLRSHSERSNYLLVKEARIIAMTCTHAALKRREFVKLGFKYDNVIMEEAAQILEVETFIPLLLQNSNQDTGASRLQRVVMIGDHNQLPPVVKNPAFQRYGNMEQSLFTRFVRLGVPTYQLDAQGRARDSIANLFRWKYSHLGNLPSVTEDPAFQLANPGLCYEFQAVNVADFQGKGETEPRPHFIQNLGEAEYVVAMFQYMRLNGYPADKISILTTYNGQKDLICDVLERRCSWNPLFGLPKHVSTVDQFQGQQNDYILLSLVRTKTVGHLRDVRRLIVAMSRARLGLYVFCRFKLFASCHELQPVMSQFKDRSTELCLCSGESYTETLDDEKAIKRTVETTNVVPGGNGKFKAAVGCKKKVTVIQDVVHMGQHIANVTQNSIRDIRIERNGGIDPVVEARQKKEAERTKRIEDLVRRKMLVPGAMKELMNAAMSSFSFGLSSGSKPRGKSTTETIKCMFEGEKLESGDYLLILQTVNKQITEIFSNISARASIRLKK
ncbi:hypothetical protein DFS34DRAFT_249440 [Phlyctochytrium arcticum]|nr:hypothetical protein DFS34DRAFT_249440 [Phlyctochytrium arcticum]